jgi:microcystin-dependent protein
MASRNRDFFTLTAHQKPMTGDTKFSALSVDHMGWLVCDGRALNVTDYRFLFDVIGYSFGSNGVSQFKLPDPAGRVIGVIGSGTGLTTRALGDTVGAETHVLTIPEMPSHNHGTDVSGSIVGNGLTDISGAHIHGITDPGHTHTINTANAGATIPDRVGQGIDNVSEGPASTNSNTTGITINAGGNHQHSIATQGGDQPHNNMQPTLFAGNMFMFSGKFSFVGAPFTSGIYVGSNGVPSGANVV